MCKTVEDKTFSLLSLCSVQCVCVCVSYGAVGLYVRSLQSDGDAVEEDEDQNHVVEQFVRDQILAPNTESEHAQKHHKIYRVAHKMRTIGPLDKLCMCVYRRSCV